MKVLMLVRERELRERANGIFAPASFGVGNIYHRVRKGERRLMVVSVYGLVAQKNQVVVQHHLSVL